MAPTVDTCGDYRGRLIDRATRWLFGQEAVVVVLVAILSAVVYGMAWIYGDMQSALQDASLKQESARKEFLDRNDHVRSEAKAEAKEMRETMLETTRELSRGITSSVDRLTSSVERLAEETRRARP